MPVIRFKHPRATLEDLGMIPAIVLDADPRPLREQIEDRYSHGGGYCSMGNEFTVTADGKLSSDKYPDDPPFIPVAEMKFVNHAETLTLFSHGMVRIEQADGSFDVIRMD